MSTQTNETKTGFLDYAGLSKFWELVRAKVAAELSATTGTDGVKIQLKDVDGKSLGNGGTIPFATPTTAGLMTSEQVAQLNRIGGDIESKIALNGIQVKGTEATIADKKINIDLTYDKNSQSIKIVDLNNNSAVLTSISATDFIANGIFKNAQFVENSEDHKIYLRLTFTMPGVDAEGKEITNTIDIQVTDLITKYEAGDGISIADETQWIGDNAVNSGKITLKIDSAATEKYIKCGTRGVYTEGINTAITNAKNEALNSALAADKTTKSIKIAGGPLANNIAEGSEDEEWPWTDNAGNKVIPAGKSLEDILTALFLKVVEGTVKKYDPVWNPKLTQPSITIVSNTDTNTAVSGTVEVGTMVAAKVVTSNELTGKTRTQTFECSHGYFIGTDNTWKEGNYVASKTGSIKGAISADNKASVSSMTWNSKAPEAQNVTTTTSNDNKFIDTVIVKNLVVTEESNGTNTFKATQKGLSATVDAFTNAGTKIYASKNTKEKIDNTFETIDSTTPDDIALTSSNSKTITGKRYMFCGALKDAPDSGLTSAIIRNNTSAFGKAIPASTVNPDTEPSKFFIKLPGLNDTTAPKGVKYFYIAVPTASKLSLKTVFDSVLKEGVGSIGDFTLPENIKTVSVEGANEYKAVEYTVYTFKSGTYIQSAEGANLMIRIENAK